MQKNKKSLLANNWVVCGLALICTFLWGSAFPCVKTGYRLFSIVSTDTGSQMLFAGYRFILAGILTLLIGWGVGKRFPIPGKAIRKKVLLLGLLQTTAQYVFFYIGLSHVEGAKGSIITASNYFIAIVMAHLVFSKKRGYSGADQLNLRKIIGCLLGLAGVLLVNLTPGGFSGTFSLNGEGFLLICAVAAASASVYLKTFAGQDDPFAITGWQFLFGGTILAAIGLMGGGSVHGFTPVSCLLLLYMAMISSVAFSLWTILLTHNPVGKVSIYGFTNPVFGVLLSGIFLGEQAFILKNLGALVLVSVGILTVNVTRRER